MIGGVTMKIQELAHFREQIHAIAAKYAIQNVYVFGSTARDEARDSSDIDLLVDLEADASMFGMTGFQYEVQELLGRHVDVIPAHLLSEIDDQEFAATILGEAVSL
jgi:hypothetical protein